MEYSVSEKNRELMDRILEMEEVHDALVFLEEDQSHSIEQQIELCMIESPTYHEESRALRYAEMLRESGNVEGIGIDSRFNVTGTIPGRGKGRILLEAHLDTVFPFGTVHGVRREGATLYAPGIYDNARGLSVLLAALRALKRTGFTLEKTLIVGGTTREESPGCGAGMAELLDRYPDVQASVSVDGGFINGINLSAKYSANVEFRFVGIGGHAGNAFGKCANPLGAASRAVAAINEIVPPEKTTYAATQLMTPETSGLGSIPDHCILRVNYRSETAEGFERIGRLIEKCVAKGCEEETERWKQDTIRWEKQVLTYLPGGLQDPHLPIIEAHYLASEALGEEVFFRAGSSNGNIAISRGIPATTVGSGLGNRKAHSVHELFCTDRAFLCPQGLLLLLLMTGGIQGRTPSCLDT